MVKRAVKAAFTLAIALGIAFVLMMPRFSNHPAVASVSAKVKRLLRPGSAR
ncbi:MAG: hypothetical protein KME45_29380 [Stenomitos rutilans HA7619-LM2]|nr:hypothetical protein [Stenomitos rutilans HA7619-LM2]